MPTKRRLLSIDAKVLQTDLIRGLEAQMKELQDHRDDHTQLTYEKTKKDLEMELKDAKQINGATVEKKYKSWLKKY